MTERCGSGAPALPVDLVVQVLLLVDRKERMQCCALVNHSWNRAANLTISNLTCTTGRAARYQALSCWLCNNSSHVRSIEVRSWLCSSDVDTSQLHTLHLPIKQLQQLEILAVESCRLQCMTTAVAPRSSAVTKATQASLATLPALRTLRLNDCVGNVGVLGSCTGLQHLQLSPAPPSDICRGSNAAEDEAAGVLEAGLAAALPQLQQLTHLALNESDKKGMCMLQFDLFSPALASLQQLQVLLIGPGVNLPQSSLAHLPTSLRKLEIVCSRFGSKSALSLEAAPYLGRLINLQHLHLHDVQLEDPELLLSCTQLTGLDLQWRNLEDSDPSQDDEERMMILLEVLQYFKQLRHLCFEERTGHSMIDLAPYAALTASSHLTSLDISSCFMETEAVHSIFAATKPCRGLLQASLPSQLFEYGGKYQLLASCCPALQELYMMYPWSEYIAQTDLQGISALQALTGLTALRIDGLQLSDDALHSIAKCQRLNDLDLAVDGVFIKGLQHLTQLTGLTRLSFEPLDLEQPQHIFLINQADAGCLPDVHQQLKRHLEQQQHQEPSSSG